MSAPTPSRSKRYTPPGPSPAPATAGARTTGRGDGAAGALGRGGRVTGPPGVHGARRVAAAVIDAVLVPLAVLGVAEIAWWSGALRAVGVTEGGWDAWSRSYAQVAWTVVAAAAAYHGVCTAAWRRTVGKALMGLAIATDDGGHPSLTLSLWRAAWNAVIYAPAVLAPAVVVVGWLSLSGPRHRSLADRAAGTRVVRAAPASR